MTMKEKLAAFFRTRAALPKLCYLAAALLWLAWGLYCRLDDIGLAWSTVPVADFELADMVPAAELQNGYTTTSADPQMCLTGLAGRKLRTVSYVPLFVDDDPREVCLYYTTRPGEPYSRDKRVFPHVEGSGRYVFVLPHGSDIVDLRIDPCSPEAEHSMTLAFVSGTVDLNYPSTLPRGWTCFLPSWYQLFCLLLYPALAAAALDWLRAAWRMLKKR